MGTKKETLEQIYKEFGFQARFEPYLSSIDTSDLADARYIGRVVQLVYASDKEGEWVEYEHDFVSRPAIYEIGTGGGERIESLLDIRPDDLADVVLLGEFVEAIIQRDDGALDKIGSPGWLYYEPHSGLLLVETDEVNYAISGWRIGRWIMG